MVGSIDRWIDSDYTGRMSGVLIIEEQQVHAGCAPGEDAEIGAARNQRGAQGMAPAAGLELHRGGQNGRHTHQAASIRGDSTRFEIAVSSPSHSKFRVLSMCWVARQRQFPAGVPG